MSENKTVEFEFVLTDDELRKRIIQSASPYIWRSCSYQNLNLAYGVVDKDRTIFVTLAYIMSDMIKRCDDGYDDYEFVVLTKDVGTKISFIMDSSRDIKRLHICPELKEKEELIKEAIRFYKSYKEERIFEAKLKENNLEVDLYKLRRDYVTQFENGLL